MNDKFIFKCADKQTGYISHNKMPEYYKSIDIIICFSKCEGTPNQILEASSSSRVWISTDVGIVSELNNTDRPCGLIIDGTVDELKKALLTLYDNRNLIIEMANNGRKAIEKKWDWKIRANEFYKLFDKATLSH